MLMLLPMASCQITAFCVSFRRRPWDSRRVKFLRGLLFAKLRRGIEKDLLSSLTE